MHHLNKLATRIFSKLVEGLDAVGDSKRIANNDSFMPVIVEFNGTYGEGRIFSLTHYGEQNGDLMSDPDMTFLADAVDRVCPLTYRNDYAGVDQVAVQLGQESKVIVKEQLQFVMADFANGWLQNINEQQDLWIS